MPEVSVCIPVYNRRAALARAIKSVLIQGFEDYEIVVQDNASSDGSFELAMHYAARDPRIKAERNAEPVGKVGNWLRCLTRARAPYIKLLFSDDWLSEGALDVPLRVLRSRPDVGFVYTGMTWHYLTHVNECYTRGGDRDVPTPQFLAAAATVADLVPVTTSCVVLRKADALACFTADIPERSGHHTAAAAVGHSELLLWRCADRYPVVHHLSTVYAHSEQAHGGAPGSREQFADRHEALWWAHRTAFAYFLELSVQPLRVRRALATVLFAATVPARPGAGRNLARHLLISPGFRLRDLRPWRRPAAGHVIRLIIRPSRSTDILGVPAPAMLPAPGRDVEHPDT